MPEAPIDPRDLTPRARTVALLLIAAALVCAGVGQIHFRLADATGNIQYDVVALQRNAALLWYALAGGAVVALGRWTRHWRVPTWPSSQTWRIALLALLCLAAWLRLHRLHELPPGLWVDEALNGVQVMQIAARGRPLVALPPEDVRTGLGAGYVDVAAVAFALFDPSDGPYALRAVAAALGTAGVAALAALAWTLYGVRVAIAATAWLAVSQWHLNYSRWGEMPIMSPLLETLVVLGVVIGLRARGWRSWCGFLAAGLCAGAGVYTYQTFRLFIVLAAAAGLLLVLRRPRAVLAHGRAVAAALLVALAVAVPMLRYAATAPADFSERARGTLILGRDDWRAQLAESVPRTLLAFNLIGDDNPRHNLPFAPLLTVVPGMLAPLGLALCLARWRTLRFAIVPIWLAVALVPGLITLEAPHASRLLDAIVPLALAIGIAADVLLGVLCAALSPRLRWLVAAAALAALALTAAQEYRTYFVERERRPEFFDGFAPWESVPGRYLAADPPHATVYLDPITYWSPATQFVARRYFDMPSDVRMLRVQHDFPPPEALSGDALYLLPRPYASLAPVIRALAPQARCDEVRDPFDRINLVACRVPSAALAALRASAADGSLRWPYGLRGRFYASAAGGDAPIAEAVLPFAFCEYSLDEAPFGRFVRAEWDGFIDIERPGEYLFRLHPDSSTLVIDGRRVIDHAGERASGAGHDGHVVLPAGRLPIRITLDPGPAGRYFLWFVWQPPGGEVEIVPAPTLHPPR